jgi:UDPglucose 6-dehydrogenase
VSVVGLGKLGSPLAALFASRGIDVFGYDSNPNRIHELSTGIVPLVSTEESNSINMVTVRPVTYCLGIDALAETDMTFVVVPTPSNHDGDYNLNAVMDACEKLGAMMKKKKKRHTIIITSTVMPGHTSGPIRSWLENASGLKCGEHFGLAYHPEFIALGEVMRGMAYPDFLLVGTDDPTVVHNLRHLYELIGVNAGMVVCRPINAEIAKLMINAFVTAKISYANLVARICEGLPGADAHEVTMAMGRDHRIGLSYLKGGLPFGGPCFPRDNRALVSVCNQAGTSSLLPSTVDTFNDWQYLDLLTAIKRHCVGNVAILGKSYKLGTDVTEQAFGTYLAKNIPGSVACDTPAGMATWYYETLIIALPIDVPAELGRGKVIIDCWRSSPHLAHVAKQYIQLGRFLGPCR